MKLPHIPLSFLDASATDLSPGEIGRPQYTTVPWTGYELHEDWSEIRLFETGFPWRWLVLERLAIALYIRRVVTTNLGRTLSRIPAWTGLNVLLRGTR